MKQLQNDGLQEIPVVMNVFKRYKPKKEKTFSTLKETRPNLISIPIEISKCLNSNLNIAFWNARSINNKIICLQDFLLSNNIDILALAETWLTTEDESSTNMTNMTIAKILPKGYAMLHIPRSDGRIGGGVGMIFNESVPAKFVLTSNHKKFKQFECCTVMIQFVSSTLRFSTVYRPQPTPANTLKLKYFWKAWSEFLLQHVEKRNDCT